MKFRRLLRFRFLNVTHYLARNSKCQMLIVGRMQVDLEIYVQLSRDPKTLVVDEAKKLGATHVVLDRSVHVFLSRSSVHALWSGMDMSERTMHLITCT